MKEEKKIVSRSILIKKEIIEALKALEGIKKKLQKLL